MAKWRNQIKLKKYLTDEESEVAVKRICEMVIPQLKLINSRETNWLKNTSAARIVKDNVEYTVEQLEELIGEFEWILSSIDDNEDAKEYSYDSWCDALNEYLRQLYDLGDVIVDWRGYTNSEKFLWVG